MTQSFLFNAIVLAAGKGTRMKSSLLKVLHAIAGKPILSYVLDTVTACKGRLFLVVGHQAALVQEQFSDLGTTFVTQHQQLGTGHAVQQVMPVLPASDLPTIILAGDCPLIQADTLNRLLHTHLETQSSCTVLTTHMDNPTGYGRIVRDDTDQVLGIVEEKDCNPDQRLITEINSGIYAFNTAYLREYIQKLTANNQQNEYYLTDILRLLKETGHTVSSVSTETPDEVLGINSRQDLAKSSQIVYAQVNDHHMSNGVTIIDPNSTFIDSSVTIGQETIIHPFSILKGTTVIGKHCVIGPFSVLTNEEIADHTQFGEATDLALEIIQ